MSRSPKRLLQAAVSPTELFTSSSVAARRLVGLWGAPTGKHLCGTARPLGWPDLGGLSDARPGLLTSVTRDVP